MSNPEKDPVFPHIYQRRVGNYQNFVYLWVDPAGQTCSLVDPHEGSLAAFQNVFATGLALTAVYLTHSHWDHTNGLVEILALSPGLAVYLHADDRIRLNPDYGVKNLVDLADGQGLTLGPLQGQVHHTPGHTAGSVCFELKDSKGEYLFTGDTLFIRDCGRTDLPSGSDVAMFDSIQKIKRLSDALNILPGHQYKPEPRSTLRKERLENPYFGAKDLKSFIDLG